MPKQEEHERLENLVEQHHGGPHTARNLPAAANADNQLEGYAAINGLTEDDELARIALENADKQKDTVPDDDDRFRAESEARRRRE